MTSDPVINDVLERLVRAFNPLKIILFGSRARGDARSDSDVDLLVVMPDGTDRRAAAVAMRYRLADMPIAKDIVVTTPDEISRRRHVVGSVLGPALTEGKVLHERA
jgi:predicted nucleotidyltransferase